MKKLPVVLFFAIAAFSLSSCADFFQGKVPMDTSKEDLSSLYDLLTPPVKITSLLVFYQHFWIYATAQFTPIFISPPQ